MCVFVHRNGCRYIIAVPPHPQTTFTRIIKVRMIFADATLTQHAVINKMSTVKHKVM